MQQLSHSGQQICSVSRKPIQGQAENSSPEHRLSFKQQYYNCSGPKRWLQRARERGKKKKNQSSELAIPSGPLLLTSTATISPQCFLATQEPGNTRRKSLLSWRQREKSERLKDVNKQAQRWTNTPALSSTCTCGKQTQGTCAPVWPTLYSSLDIDPNLTPVD